MQFITGTVVPYAGEVQNQKVSSSGWLVCDGKEYNKKDYPALFDVIGTLYGGDGINTFRVPDYRGRFLRGVDGDAQRDPDANARQKPNDTAQASGNMVGSVQEDEFKEHTHQYSKFPSIEGGNIAGGSYWEPGLDNTGSTGGSETRPKNQYVNYLILAK